jgi:hypothetical protein
MTLEPAPDPDERLRIAALATIDAAIEGYLSGRLPLWRFTAETKAAISSLESVDTGPVARRLRSLWWELELVNAVTLEERRDPSDEERRTIDDVVSQLGGVPGVRSNGTIERV